MRFINNSLSEVRLILAFLAMLWSSALIGQTAQDCLGALPLCTNYITVGNPYPYSGNGNTANEIGNAGGCYCTEANGVWYKFTVQSAGTLRFELTPSNSNTDYDWILFNMGTSTACSTLASSSGASGAMARSNTWGAFGFNGATGISTPNGGSGTCNGPGTTNGPKWCADLSVSVGQNYILYISNWSNSNTGFTLDFSSSTAVITDMESPAMSSILSSVECDPFDTLQILFDEKILCSSVSTSDFELVGPGGTHTITSVTGATCPTTSSGSTVWTIEFSPPVTQIGNYTLSILPGAGFVEDMCGNLDTLDSLSFYYAGTVDVSVAGTSPICNGFCTGTVTATTVGGYEPIDFAWNNGLGPMSLHDSLCAASYIVTVTDSLGCTAIDTFQVTQPDPFYFSFDTVLNVSCPATTNCDGGAEVAVSGSTPPYSLLWTSNETGPIADQLCAGTNTVVATDINGCTASDSVEVLIPEPIVTVAFGDTQICISNAAAVAAFSSGGAPPFTYVWTEDEPGGDTATFGQAVLLSPIVSQAYVVSSTDSRGCAGDTGSVMVKVRPPLGAEFLPTDTICPYDDISLTVQGTGGDSIYSYAWAAGGFGPTLLASPNAPAWYAVSVTDLCGTPAAVDSVFVQVGGYPPIVASIRVEDDSICPGESIYLIASGRGGFNWPDEYRFKWSHRADTHAILFETPLHTSTYVLTVSDLCLSPVGIDTLVVSVGKTAVPTLATTPAEACSESEVFFMADSLAEGYQYDIELGDGQWLQNLQELSFTHQYTDPGCYDVKVNLVSDHGCSAQRIYPCAVRILDEPEAAFANAPAQPTSLNPIVTFSNQSIGADHAEWYANGLTAGSDEQLILEFSEVGDTMSVMLVATSADGCTDTALSRIALELETVLYYPTSFTPNGDGRNDEFKILGEAIARDDFELTVFDRWGTQLFSSNNPARGWDGKLTNGTPLTNGVYPFLLRYRNAAGDIETVSDVVVLSKAGERTGLR